jgi:hypothetical protein
MKQYNSIEDQLAQKLKERTIAPSGNAWERVAYNRKAKKKQSRRGLWYGVAASVVVAAGLLGLLFNDPDAAGTQPAVKVVVQQQEPPQEASGPAAGSENQQPVSVAAATVYKRGTAPDSNGREAVSALSLNSPNPVAAVTETELQKINEVAAIITTMSEKGGRVTSAEIDSLLLSAQRDIAMGRSGTIQRTDDMALLKEAETEVDKSFREKALSIFKHKFKTIKVAIK